MRRTAGAPAFVLIKPSAFEFASAAYPLDTGAFKLELYAASIDDSLSPGDFRFGPGLDDVKKVLIYFYESNDSYFNHSPRAGINIPPGNDEVEAYYDVIANHGIQDLDQRSSTIEIALSSAIEISPEWIECVLIPDQLLDALDYGALIKRLGINCISYSFKPGCRPADYTSRIFDAVFSYYKDNGLL